MNWLGVLRRPACKRVRVSLETDSRATVAMQKDDSPRLYLMDNLARPVDDDDDDYDDDDDD